MIPGIFAFWWMADMWMGKEEVFDPEAPLTIAPTPRTTASSSSPPSLTSLASASPMNKESNSCGSFRLFMNRAKKSLENFVEWARSIMLPPPKPPPLHEHYHRYSTTLIHY
jgi:hypothetical protein